MLTVEQILAGVQSKNAVQDERLDHHDKEIAALRVDVSWNKKVLIFALGVLAGVAPATAIDVFKTLFGAA